METIRKPSIIFAIVVAIISFAIVYSAPLNDLWKGLVALPGIGALGASLFQVFRDDLAHQRRSELQAEQQLFNLGATSHMANIVFDKHVEFCEAYMAEVEEMLETCFRKGPHQDVLNHTKKLYKIRQKYTAWIPEHMVARLEPYEQVARELGASADAAALLIGDDPAGQRSAFVDRMHERFSELLGINIGDGNGEDENKEAAIVSLRTEVREILQVNDLIAVREHLIRRAAQSANSGT